MEKATIKLLPNNVVMESETELTQYVIAKWSLQYRSSKIYFDKIKLVIMCLKVTLTTELIWR